MKQIVLYDWWNNLPQSEKKKLSFKYYPYLGGGTPNIWEKEYICMQENNLKRENVL